MMELDKFEYPMTISQIPAIFGYLDRIADVVDIFKEYVKDQDAIANDNKTRKTLRSPVLCSLTIKN